MNRRQFLLFGSFPLLFTVAPNLAARAMPPTPTIAFYDRAERYARYLIETRFNALRNLK